MRLFFFFFVSLSLPPLPFLLLQRLQEKLPEPPDRAHMRALPGSAAWPGTLTCPPFPTPFPRGSLLPAKSCKKKLLEFPRGSAATGIGRAPRSRCDPNTPERDLGAVGAAKLMSSTQVCPGVSPIPGSKPEPKSEVTHHSMNLRVYVVSMGRSTEGTERQREGQKNPNIPISPNFLRPHISSPLGQQGQ